MKKEPTRGKLALYKLIHGLRAHKGISQVELARMAKISLRSIKRLESQTSASGGYRPRIKTLKKLAKALGLPERQLLVAAGYPVGAPPKVDLSDITSLPVGLQELIKSREYKILKVSTRELEALASVGTSFPALSKDAYISILLEIRREEGRSVFG